MTERFARLLKQRIGLDLESVGELVIDRAVQQRVKSCGCGSLDAYWTLLSGSIGEQQELVEAVVVGETWFFRYPESFAALQRLALQRPGGPEPGRPLRILSLPCSTGEEPYSIVMSLLDAGLNQFSVDALDISQQALDQAQAGLYGRNAFRGGDLAFRDRHFTPVAGGHRLSDAVRERVRFHCGNLLEPGLLAGEPPFDFVFCRNLLIYFDRPTQVRALEVLKRLMAKDGALFIGPAEASLFSQAGLEPLGIPQAFVFRHPSARPETPPEPRVVPPRQPRPLPVRPVPGAAFPARRPAARPASPVARTEPAPAAETREALLQRLETLSNQGRTDDARRVAEQLLAEYGPAADVFYWQALLHEVANELDAAQALYRKVLYMEPQHPEALVHLATLLAAQGDLVGAQRLQQRADRGVRTHER